ncbi:MAG TPA: prepilin-type N-terminal cleavage/methylation domain-containing protein [Pyrinomonadaceae bacterium]|jgi:type II secretory pathway pseudopilin PulG|nr:prepilin-type N-terminal cleavage/methylation domain-containing protein [Pyrinomonadaceae bacterium]
MSSSNKKATSGGFSLLELLIAMVITMALMTAASTLLANALRVRSRENQKSDALADVQRALNIMSREVANAGFNLSNNGIVSDSGPNRLRIRANLNRFMVDDPSLTTTQRETAQDSNEDITYYLNDVDQTRYLARYDLYGNGGTVLANRIDSMNFHYFDQKVTYTAAPGDDDITSVSAVEVTDVTRAKYIVIAVSVTLDAVGTPGSPGYQPPYSVLLCSDVTLRNADLWSY